MITTFLLVYFLHNLKGEGIEDQMTLAHYDSWMSCETIRQHATSHKKDLECIGITGTIYPLKEDAQSAWIKNRIINLNEFKLKNWV